MKLAILSDIHGNLEALTSVLGNKNIRNADHFLFVGDMINYGASSVECVEIVKGICDAGKATAVPGNHEYAMVHEQTQFGTGKLTKVLLKTANTVGQFRGRHDLKDWIASLPVGGVTKSFEGVGYVHLVHGFPYHVDEKHCIEEYFMVPDMEGRHPWTRNESTSSLVREAEGAVKHAFENVPHISFVGHTHVPCIVEQGNGITNFPCVYLRESYADEKNRPKYEIGEKKVIINPGSVGQPRDGNPKASCVTLESNIATVHRIEYDIASAQQKIRNLYNKEDGEVCDDADRLADGR